MGSLAHISAISSLRIERSVTVDTASNLLSDTFFGVEVELSCKEKEKELQTRRTFILAKVNTPNVQPAKSMYLDRWRGPWAVHESTP